MKKVIVIVGVLIGLSLNVWAFDVYDDISSAIRAGNSGLIGEFFGSTVDLTILAQEDVYSRAQAQIILRDFFVKNTPKSFSILHKGTSKDGASYAIGSLLTVQGGSLRTYCYIKQVGGRNIIQELRFEKQ